jgi:IclR family mhp operon transcriptional activator
MVSRSRSETNGGVRAVARAIDLLRALNHRQHSTLHDLHRDTGLPKPSILRLLRTLQAKGFVAQSASFGTYQLLARVKALSSGFHHEPLVIEAAEELLIDYTRREGWPLSMALFDLDAMVVRACTIPHTSLSLEHSLLDRRLSLVSRALGRAYLATCTANEQKIILGILGQSKDAEDAAARDEEKIAKMIQQVRHCGYATCDPTIEPRSSTIAVPVRENERVVASLGLTWITAAMPAQKAIDLHVPHLLEIAGAISKELAARSQQATRH